MATQATIARHNTDGTFDTIYVHYDGHLGHTFRILREHYATPASVDELLELGDLSVIAEHADPGPGQDYHSFETPAKDVCIAYHRDRGESYAKTKAQRVPLLTSGETAFYTYVWSNGQWYAFAGGKPVEDQELGTMALADKLHQIKHITS
jgi:hypothetical protein